MLSKGTIILGVFSDPSHADKVVTDLKRRGLDFKNISIISKDLEWAGNAHGKEEQVAKGVLAGAGTGAALGALTGLLVGLGTVTIPGLGPLLIAGPLASMLGITGAAASTLTGAAGGALAGGLVGALAGLGLPRDVAVKYEERIRQGAVILAVTVYTMEDEEQVMEMYERHDAEDIHIIGSRDIGRREQNQLGA